MTSFKYKLIIQFMTGDVFPHVKDLEKSVNNFMGDFGFHEKIRFQSEAPVIEMDSDHPFTQEEKESVMELMNNRLAAKGINMKCTGIEENF